MAIEPENKIGCSWKHSGELEKKGRNHTFLSSQTFTINYRPALKIDNKESSWK